MYNISHSRNKLLLLYTNPRHQAQHEKVSGVYAAAIRRGWQIIPISESPTPTAVKQHLNIWHPKGIIIDPINLPFSLNSSSFHNLPVVLLGTEPKKRKQCFDCAKADPRKIVELAVEELAARELEAFAFIGYHERPIWSVERGKIFRELLADKRIYEYQGSDPSTPTGNAELTTWLSRLPHPLGIFLSTDHLAPQFFTAAQQANLKIPDDCSVVSVDNIEQICLNVEPALTSVYVGFSQCGELAVRLLEKRLETANCPPETATYAPIGITRRASSSIRHYDRRVMSALTFIDEHFLDPISSIDVVKIMKGSRRQAELLFHHETGKSILTAIQDARLDKAKALLHTPGIQMKNIPALCGYESAAYFKTLFLKRIGMTMRAYRASNTNKAS